jgi:NAD(P)-dependent dehydrogenase (short-subunit alcohol dehydrogenase family)
VASGSRWRCNWLGLAPRSSSPAAILERAPTPVANVRFEVLDLANLKSVADFAARLSNERSALDLLVNNAGVMVPPRRLETADGLELQLGTNYLSHFALTAQLLPLLRQGKAARVVALSSVASRAGVIDFDDLQARNRYDRMRAYSQSKLACLLFAFELQRRSEAAGWGVTSIAAHPGIARTDLLHNAPGRFSLFGIVRSLLWFLFQPTWQGALPTLFAATSAEAVPGAYYGPNRLGETRGFPALAQVPTAAQDLAVAERLWRRSEQLTGSYFPEPAS